MTSPNAPTRGATRAALFTFAVLAAGCGAEEEAAPPATTAIAPEANSAAVEPRAKNVLLFVVDTLRADRLGAYGYDRETSPHVDAFAREGTTWLDNRSQSNWTNPSMVSMMTGLWITNEEQVLPKRYPTLAELHQESGFATAAFVANRTLTTGRGFQRGFDDFMYENVPGPQLVGHFANWLDSHAAAENERGFFVWIHLLDPHTPFEPLDRFDVFSGPRSNQAELERRWEREARGYFGDEDVSSSPEFAASIEWMELNSNLYDGEVHQADAAFGLALRALKKHGLLDETLVVFAADHGEMLFEYPSYPHERETRRRTRQKKKEVMGVEDLMTFSHRAWFYPELWNTPLIVRGPGFERGAKRRGLSGNIDIFPTVLAATGIDYEGERPGLDLHVADLEQRHHVFAHGFLTSTLLEVGGLQLIAVPPERLLQPSSHPRTLELFDVTTGPELLPLQDERPREVARLNDVLREWRQRWTRTDAINKIDSDEAREALRELGYLDDE